MKAVSRQNSKYYGGLWWLCQGGLLVGLCGFTSFALLSGCAVPISSPVASESLSSDSPNAGARSRKKVAHRLCAKCDEKEGEVDDLSTEKPGRVPRRQVAREVNRGELTAPKVEPVNFVR